MLIIYLVLVLCFKFVRNEDVEITIPPGRILGNKTNAVPSGKSYYSFKGIRYAETPARFEAATEKLPWDDVYNATVYQSACIEVAVKSGSEDCLFINVHTPNLPTETDNLLPVMFWIYGGAFIDGSSNLYAPDYFMDEDVVLVSLNYRLGIFGFLSTGDERIPGNNGLKDVILGLEWVQQNIKYFNGDPSQVTIFGQSAGAALTSYLTISPLTQGKGYFVRSIMQSGNALSPWGLQRHPNRNYRQVLGNSICGLFSFLGWDLWCLRRLSAKTLAKIGTLVLGINAAIGLDFINGISFSPVYEVASPNAALLEGSYSILEEGRVKPVPFIMGVNSEEVLAFTPAFPILRPLLLQADLQATILVPEDMHANASDKTDYIIPAIRRYYFTNSTLTATAPDSQLVQFFSDTQFNKPLREYLTLIGNSTNNYCYQFSYVGNPTLQFRRKLEGVGHGEELDYFFMNHTNVTLSQSDIIVKNKVIRLWTNFAKYGNPTPTTNDTVLDGFIWESAPINGTDVTCLNIDTNLEMISNPKDKSYQMWRDLYENYGHPNSTY